VRTRGARELAAPITDFATPWLARRHRKLLRLGRGLDDASAEERHEVRLAAKRLRYAAEFFANAFPGRRTADYRKALARLQDALGAQVDAHVALRLAYAIEGAGSPAATVLEAWIARDAKRARASLHKRWRAFRDAPLFFEA
jgi:CHAD domain-containing protein